LSEGAKEVVAGEKQGRLLWADTNEDVGLRMRVIEKDAPAPVLRALDEDVAVGYTLQYEGLISFLLFFFDMICHDWQV